MDHHQLHLAIQNIPTLAWYEGGLPEIVRVAARGGGTKGASGHLGPHFQRLKIHQLQFKGVEIQRSSLVYLIKWS